MTQQQQKSLLIPILIGIVIGILVGGILPAVGISIAFLGELFINALLMLVIPLVMTSMIASITGLGDVRQLGGIGGKTIIFYTITTGLAVLLGLLLVNIIQPGVADTEADRVALRGGQVLENVAYEINDNTISFDGATIRKPFDDRYMAVLEDQNEIRGTIAPEQQSKGSLTVTGWTNPAGESVTPKATGQGVQIDLAVADKIKGKEESSIGAVLKEVIIGLLPQNLFGAMVDNDVLPLIIFSLLFGGVLTTLGERGERVILLVEGLNDAIMRIIDLVLLTAPVGIAALIAGRLGEAGGFGGFAAEFASLGKYAATVIVALLIHGLVVLPLILKFVGKRNPFVYIRRMLPALTTAFSTASSSATLPLSMECVIEKNHVSHRIANFVLPLGATINMDGTALYEAVAAVFIAQIYGINLSFGHLVVIFLTATLAAIGAAGIPEAGLVTMVIVLRAVNIPIEGVSLILVIDWFLDRCRTTVNVWGDCVGAGVIDRLERGTGKPATVEEPAVIPSGV
ncbi:dicarboxylate/amino acid:cation symporter [Myxosarcina sp. GI1]|uniref:dicarboxylate/amino acid:cation symporter n=1 Tax=Myxosarcina sp. GI1 TaxID=1541065 RepID=UPI00068FDA2C|nr:dicarboxylate/amino acid:cation symporter [Myxosarcina sp. GI1]